ncbi:MAG: biotin/lipoyl-containing protein, partial [Pyrinomonadaceae bacterium]
MSTEVVMPQMGESIAEGTITKWLKQVGDRVERDEPLFEISTDKVDAEIPSPAAGTLTEIRFKEGETVEINTTVAVLDGGAAAPAKIEASSQAGPATLPATERATAEPADPAPVQPQIEAAAAASAEVEPTSKAKAATSQSDGSEAESPSTSAGTSATSKSSASA